VAERVFRELIDIMARLRGPDGCPWDRAQTLADVARYLREEAAEVEEAVRTKSRAEVAEELGDLLFNVVFAARLAEEEGAFDIGKVLEGIRDKIVRRHPHVFGDAKASTPGEVLLLWNKAKEEERRRR
jgi:tetrapyrrole methylase family protein/MazG family protein